LTKKWLPGMLALTMSKPAATACSIGALTGMAFGSYDVFSSEDTLGAGNIQVTCDQPFSISLSAGANSNNYRTRRMAGPNGSYLFYNLYSDVDHLSLWGDSTDPSQMVHGKGTGQAESFDVYGVIGHGQTAASVGTYGDSILVLVTF